jgi:hypothetical protein
VGGLIGVALLALLLAQWLAVSHAIAHAPRSAGEVVAEDADSHWGHDAGTPTCTLIEHLLAGESAAGDPPGMACLPPDATLHTAPRCPLVCGATRQAYEARGPPRA